MMRLSRAKICCLLSALLMIGAGLQPIAPPARAGILDTLRDKLGLGGRENKRNAARAARSRASILEARADSQQAKLRGIQRTLLRANGYYFNYRHQMKRTEAQIVRERHRRLLVTERYNRRRILFGRRLAAMQRTGKTGYLQIFLGSKTLSDLTRRFYLFRALVTRDSQLQQELRSDKSELEALNIGLSRQWKQRNALQRQANRERLRVAQAAGEQQSTLKRIVRSRNEMLAYASTQVQSIKEIDREVMEYNARQRALAAQQEAEEEAAAAYAYQRRRDEERQQRDEERQQQRRTRRSYRTVSRDDEDDNNDGDAQRSSGRVRSRLRSSYGARRSYRRVRSSRYRSAGYRYRRAPRRYRTVQMARRIDRVRYVPSPGGRLKPMSISEIVFKDEVVPVGSSGGALSSASSQSSAGSAKGSSSSPPPPAGDDFPASDP